MRKTLLALVLAQVSLFTLGQSAPTMADDGNDAQMAQAPDLVVVGWTIDDAAGGNDDNGLHPGETAYLWISVSNRGNETARWVDGQLSEIVDHPDVEILDKYATWPDLSASGAPAWSDHPHFRVRVAPTLPCDWPISLRLQLTADGGYLVEHEIVLVMTDPRRIDLARDSGRPFYFGPDGGDYLGWFVATGDLDGDGYDDLVIAAHHADGPTDTRSGAGEVHVVYGSDAVMHDTDLESPPSWAAVIYGADGNDYLGESVATGDFNGDGYDDLVIGIVEADGPENGRNGAGEAVVVYGGPERLPDIDLVAPRVHTLEGTLLAWSAGSKGKVRSTPAQESSDSFSWQHGTMSKLLNHPLLRSTFTCCAGRF